MQRLTDETGTRPGGCFCGAVHYEVSGPPLVVCVCHCTSCRHATGAAMVAWATWPAGLFRVIRGELQYVMTSPGVTRGHCANCGTSISYGNASRPDEVDVTLASLGDPPELPPTMHIWVADKLPWVVLGDGLPQFPGVPPG